MPADGSEEQQRLWVNLFKQAKFITLGSALAWYFGAHPRLEHLWASALGNVDTKANRLSGFFESLSGGLLQSSRADGVGLWSWIFAVLSLLFLLATIALFAVLMLLPLTGHRPNFSAWHNDAILRKLIPLLTFTLVAGFTTLITSFTSTASQATTQGSFDGARHIFASTQHADEPIHFSFVTRLSAAFGAATGVYLLVLGTVGLLGVFVAPVRKTKGQKEQ
ncbi:unnamed protein product [Parajaminaea phylloscopi]